MILLRKARQRQDKGYIFVMALVVIAGLLALLAMMVADQRAESQATIYRLRQYRAQSAADAGVARAETLIAAANTNLVTSNDTWAQLGTGGAQEFDLPDGTSFRMAMTDASSLVNLNMSSIAQLQSQLQLLPIDQTHIDSLLDWRQTGESARTDGAKDSYYNALPQPYNAKLGPLTTVNELLLVDNWTAQNLYGPATTMSASGGSTGSPISTTSSSAQPLPSDTQGNTLPLAALFTVDAGSPNTRAIGSTRINFNTRNLSRRTLAGLGMGGGLLNRVIAGAPYTSFRTLFSVRGMNRTVMQNLLDNVGFTTATRATGKINLNTATLTVLQTVPNLSQSTATAIVQQQTTGFQTLGALANVQGITTGQLAQVADYFSVGSDTWIVRSYGKDEDTYYAEEAVVGFRNGKIKIINQEKINTVGVPEWWNWSTQTSGTEDAGTQQ